MSHPDEAFLHYLVTLRNHLQSHVLTKEEALWSLVQSKLTIEVAIAHMMDETTPGGIQIPDGWPPNG